MSVYETRDIIYGFITYDDWEREVINHPVFQRLRRIKQLSLTDMIYPGANHTRFEHSLGVMHLSTLFYDSILGKRKQFLKDVLNFNEAGFERDRRIIRFAALLHDIGHSSFSHAGEELMPYVPKGNPKYREGANKRFSHEDYSIAIIKAYFKDIIENHKENDNYDIRIEDITAERSGFFPLPDDDKNLKKYIEYDDWIMYGLLKEGLGGEHGKIILERTHDKCVHETSEVPDEVELDRFEDVFNTFRNEISFDDSSEKSWYKTGKEDIIILCSPGEKNERLEPLSRKSSIVRTMQPIKQKRLYVKNGLRKTVKEKIDKYLEGRK